MGSNMGSHIEVAKPAIFNGEVEKVGGFVIACRLYLRMKIKEAIVKDVIRRECEQTLARVRVSQT